jgi:MFS family permease
VFSFGIMGAARGIDEGLISGTFNQSNFQEFLGIDTLDEVALAKIKGNVSSMVQIGSISGAGLAFLLADRIGRLWATRQLCTIWILGIFIFLNNRGRLGQVYAGRFIAGMGMGRPSSSRLIIFPKLRRNRFEVFVHASSVEVSILASCWRTLYVLARCLCFL